MTAKPTAYTDSNMPPVPAAIGNWVQVKKSTKLPSLWVCEYQNSVGGSVAYRFATKRAAKAYAAMLPKAAA